MNLFHSGRQEWRLEQLELTGGDPPQQHRGARALRARLELLAHLPRAGDVVEGYILTLCISRLICTPIELELSRRGGHLTWFGGAAARASSTARRSGSGRLGLEQSGDWRLPGTGSVEWQSFHRNTYK